MQNIAVVMLNVENPNVSDDMFWKSLQHSLIEGMTFSTRHKSIVFYFKVYHVHVSAHNDVRVIVAHQLLVPDDYYAFHTKCDDETDIERRTGWQGVRHKAPDRVRNAVYEADNAIRGSV